MDLGIAGRKAAVGAATAGLGRAAAAALIAEGVQVTICGSNAERAKAAADELGANWLVADLTDPDAAGRFVEEARAAMGGLDILVVNGPGPAAGTVAETPADAYQGALERSLLAPVRMCLAALPGMRAQKWGRIVAITSISVRQPIGNLVLSTTARTGATGFLKTLAREVAADGITVNSLQPGAHTTGRITKVYGDDLPLDDIPAGRLGDPDHFGAIVTFLCSAQAAHITGVAVPVDGGEYQALL